MLDVCEMVKAITFGTGKEDFTSPTNAKRRLRKYLNDDPELIRGYLSMVDRVPYITWGSGFSQPNLENGWDEVIRISELYKDSFKIIAPQHVEGAPLKQRGTAIPLYTHTFDPGFPGRCHQASLAVYEAVKSQDPSADIQVLTGFCRSESCSWDEWYLHSFCIYNSKVIEASGLPRDLYTGVVLRNPREDIGSFATLPEPGEMKINLPLF